MSSFYGRLTKISIGFALKTNERAKEKELIRLWVWHLLLIISILFLFSPTLFNTFSSRAGRAKEYSSSSQSHEPYRALLLIAGVGKIELSPSSTTSFSSPLFFPHSLSLPHFLFLLFMPMPNRGLLRCVMNKKRAETTVTLFHIGVISEKRSNIWRTCPERKWKRTNHKIIREKVKTRLKIISNSRLPRFSPDFYSTTEEFSRRPSFMRGDKSDKSEMAELPRTTWPLLKDHLRRGPLKIIHEFIGSCEKSLRSSRPENLSTLQKHQPLWIDEEAWKDSLLAGSSRFPCYPSRWSLQVSWFTPTAEEWLYLSKHSAQKWAFPFFPFRRETFPSPWARAKTCQESDKIEQLLLREFK